jgi:outer membrane receptor protein involved in Fe transport
MRGLTGRSRQTLLACALALIGACSTSAFAQGRRVLRVDTTDQSLAAALTDLARRSGADLLLAASNVAGRPAPLVRGRLTLEQAYPKLLEGSGLSFRRTSDGGYIVFVTPAGNREADIPVTLPELLVIGKRTQNSDIRRTENDIQPYKVWGGRDIAQAHASSLEDFLHSRVTGNALNATAAQDLDSQLGSSRSQIDLRGLGSGQTLVLVDGRRLPSLPSGANTGDVSLLQSDVNGIPLSAIERVEILNATAGGIYGAGATAGAVNVVLKRDYKGADLGVTYGLSARGDAPIKRLDGRIGFSPGDGQTDLMVSFSLASGPGLKVGDRDFTQRVRDHQAAQDYAGFVGGQPVSASVNILSISNGALVFDAAHGGASLGSAYTFAPAGYAGPASDGGALLLANAGKIDAALSPDANGAERSLLTRPKVSSLLVNARRRFGASIEVYGDLLALRNDGRSVLSQAVQQTVLPADAPDNPFTEAVTVTFPLAGFDTVLRNRTSTTRATAGLIVDLPRAWKGNLDYSRGTAKVDVQAVGGALTTDFYLLGYADQVDGPNPLAGRQAFLAAMETYRAKSDFSVSQVNRFDDLSLRLAGPVFSLPGGPLTLSLLAEERRERVGASRFNLPVYDAASPLAVPLPRVETRVRSVYGELRAPLTDRDSGPAGLKGLELQLAVRRDETRLTLPANLRPDEALNDTLITSRSSASVYTVGFRVSPIDGVMLRSSLASGFLPPRADQIASSIISYSSDLDLVQAGAGGGVGVTSRYQYIDPRSAPADPKRGGAPIATEGVYDLISGGSTHLKAERARSLSVGIVLTPTRIDRLRVSADYTRINKTGEISPFHAREPDFFLANESAYPGRVIRAPLTDADRARGYAGGIVTAIDTTNFNIAKTWVEAVDAQADYVLPTQHRGDFRFHAAATWQPTLKRRALPDSASLNTVGYFDGPLEWRGNGGLEWTRGALTLGGAATYYHHYKIRYSDDLPSTAAVRQRIQGSSRVPGQLYVDLFAARRFSLPAHGRLSAVDARVGVQNVLDHSPPVLIRTFGNPYSTYGDPRRRRFELNLVARF